MNQDPFEKENLIYVNPDIAEKLHNKYQAWASKHKVAKWPINE